MNIPIIWRGGVTWRVGGGAWCFRAPWSAPLFSERNGRHRFVFKRWGWRLFFRKDGRGDD